MGIQQMSNAKNLHQINRRQFLANFGRDAGAITISGLASCAYSQGGYEVDFGAWSRVAPRSAERVETLAQKLLNKIDA